jgi:hypothetical protein
MMSSLRRKQRNKGAKMKLLLKRRSKDRLPNKSNRPIWSWSKGKRSVASLSMSTLENSKKSKKSNNGAKKTERSANAKKRSGTSASKIEIHSWASIKLMRG